MDRHELAAVVTGRTRVQYTSGDCGTVIGPLPDGVRERDIANLLVQFDGEDQPYRIPFIRRVARYRQHGQVRSRARDPDVPDTGRRLT